MDIESYAARAALDRITPLLPDRRDQIVALFQIGAQATHMSVLLDGETVYEREQPFGGNTLTQDIVRAYGMAFEEAETRKKAGDLPENYRADLLAPFLENAALEVTRAIQFFYTSTPYTRIDQHLPGRRLRAACRACSKSSPAAPASPPPWCRPSRAWRSGPACANTQLRQEAPAYLVACGLALRRFG